MFLIKLTWPGQKPNEYGPFPAREQAVGVIDIWFECPGSYDLSAFVSENLSEKKDLAEKIQWILEREDK